MWKSVALLLLSLLLAAACSRREPGGREGRPAPAAEAGPPAGETSAGEGEIRPTREITLQRQAAPPKKGGPGAPSQAGAPSQEGEPDRPGTPSGIAAPAGPKGKLLPLRGPALLPEDFRIGPLEDLLSPGGTEKKILAASKSFLDGIASGAFVEDAVLPENRQELRRSLLYYIDEGLVPGRYRLGAICFEEQSPGSESPSAADTAWMNLRLFGTPGAAEGELYLSSSGGTWYVSDIQAGFPFLREPYERGAEKFTPSVYGWRLQ